MNSYKLLSNEYVAFVFIDWLFKIVQIYYRK